MPVVNQPESDFAKLEKLRDDLSVALSEPVELPELALVFDLGDRRGNALRTYKAIVQTTQIHVEHFRQATARSHLAILDAYLDASSNGQLVVAQSMARSMLELNGLHHEIYLRLTKIVSRVDDSNWESLGQAYWGSWCARGWAHRIHLSKRRFKVSACQLHPSNRLG